MPNIVTPQPGQPNTYQFTPEQIKSQLEFAQGLRKQGSSMEPVQGTPWLQALARGLQGGLGGYDEYSAGQDELKERQRNAAMISQLTGQGKTPTYADMLGIANDPWTSQNSMQVMDKMVEEGKPDYKTFSDPSGDVYRWNTKDPNAKPELYFKNTDQSHVLTSDEKAHLGIPPEDIIIKKPDGTYENLSKGGAININTGDKGYDTQAGKDLATAATKFQTDSNAALNANATLDVMEKQLEDPDFYSGAGGEAATKLKQIRVLLGGDPSKAAPNETFSSLGKGMVYDTLGSLGTAISDGDRGFVVGRFPNLDNTKEGNRQLIAIHRKLNQRKIEIAKLARDYAKTHGGRLDDDFYGVVEQYANEHPLFPKEEQTTTPPATDPADPANIRKKLGGG